MSYERAPSPASVWEFETADMPANNVVQVTYENGDRLFLTKKNEEWVVDQILMSLDLRIILMRYEARGFNLQRRTFNDTLSGHVGHPLTLRMFSNGERFAGRDVTCTSLRPVQSIEETVRSNIILDPKKNRPAAHIAWSA